MIPEEQITIFNERNELPSELRSLNASSLLSIIDEAQNGNTYELFAIYRDLISSDNQIQTEFAKRMGAVLGDSISIQAWDKKIAEDVIARDLCSGLIDSEPFEKCRAWLLCASLYPVAVVEKVFMPTPFGFKVKDLIPVPYRLLDYRDGTLRIFDTDSDGNVLPTSHTADQARYIIHRGHTLPLPDKWGGPMRSILFWALLRTNDRQWWADILERFGTPFMKGKYKDDKGKAILERAFRLAVRLGGIVISKETEVEIVQAASSDSSNSHQMFLDVCNKEISKLIVGQTLSSTSDPTGIGGGASGFQSEVRDDIRKSDARLLSRSIRNQLFTQLCSINGRGGNSPVIMFGSDSVTEVKALVSGVKDLYDAGLEPDDEGLSTIQERVGYGIRRRTQPSVGMPFSALALSAMPSTTSSTDKLASVLSAQDSDIAAIVRSSSSSAECIRKVREYLESHKSIDASETIAAAMDSYAEKALRK